MANKKITVVGDGAEQPLTPEEEHRLEVRVDKMLDPNVPDDTTSTDTSVPQPVAPKATPAPKVTKIVTTFADDEEPAAPTPAQPKAENPKPAVAPKKITIKHHDEVNEASEEPAPKPKAAAKKPSKKLKVTLADEPEDDLETKADAIAASALAAEQELVTKAEVGNTTAQTEEITQSVDEQTPVTDESDSSEETSEDSDQGAPPLILKHSTSPIGAEAAVDDGTNDSKPLPASAVGKKIAILHDDEPEEQTQLAGAEPEVPQTVEVAVEEIPEPAEEVAVAVEPEKTVEPKEPKKPVEIQQTDEDKKYHPPEGPLQFKRAQVPIQPKKPGEPRQEQQQATQLSEDEAIAQAFEAKSTSKGSDTARQLLGGLLRTAKWLVIIGLVAAIVAVGAVPTLRHKAMKLVGLDSPKPVSAGSVASTNPPAAKPAQSIQLTGNDVYLARRAGVYNLYKNDAATGQHEQLILAGTGKESSTGLALSMNSTNTIAALVSTRDGKVNASGDYQQSLTFVDVAGGTTSVSDTADHIKLVDWFGNTLVYVTYSDSTSTSDANRYQLISYNTATKKRVVLDHSNYLNDVLAARGTVYYATASGPSGSGEFAKIQPDGTGKSIVLAREVAAITRVSYNTVILSSVDKWYSYKLGSLQATQTNTVSQGNSRQYVDSPDGTHSVYINDAKQLILYDTKTAKETILLASGASYPLHWLNNTALVYRSDTSDYGITIAGGTPTKISDVYDTPGISLWHQQ
ncbi:MAG: hypothetical protein ACREGB_01735 [Candidatus Saccharimonadales bacterium]